MVAITKKLKPQRKRLIEDFENRTFVNKCTDVDEILAIELICDIYTRRLGAFYFDKFLI